MNEEMEKKNIDEEIPESTPAEEGAEGEQTDGLPYDLSFLEIEIDEELLAELRPKLEEFQVMEFTQEQVEYILIQMLLEEYAEDEGELPDYKTEINSKLDKEEKLAWKSTGTMLIKKLGKEHTSAIKQMMCDPAMFKVLYQLTKGDSKKNTGKSVTDAEDMGKKKTADDYYDEYMVELKNVLGDKKKVMEIKNKWLKDHPELKGKIRI